jgi:preprotein translocase subunit SecG
MLSYYKWLPPENKNKDYSTVNFSELFIVSDPGSSSQSSSKSAESSSKSSTSDEPFMDRELIIMAFIVILVLLILLGSYLAFMRKKHQKIKKNKLDGNSDDNEENSDDELTDIDVNDYRNYRGVDSLGTLNDPSSFFTEVRGANRSFVSTGSQKNNRRVPKSKKSDKSYSDLEITSKEEDIRTNMMIKTSFIMG